MSARAACKVNYAATVKEMMPYWLGSADRCTVPVPLLMRFETTRSHQCLQSGLTVGDL